MNKFKNRSLKTKAFIGFTLFAFVGFSIFWGINIAVVKQTLKKQLGTELEQSVTLAKIAVESYLIYEDKYIASTKQTLSNFFGSKIKVNNRKWKKYFINGKNYYLPMVTAKQKNIVDMKTFNTIKKTLACESFIMYQKSHSGFIPINDSSQHIFDENASISQKILKSGFYQHRVYKNGFWFLKLYFAFYNDIGDILGFYVVEKKLTEFAKLEKKLLSFKIAKTGYPFIIATSGLTILHPAKEGETALEFKDVNNFYFVKEMIRKQNGTLTYFWFNKKLGDKKPRAKLTKYLFIPKRNWIIAVSAYIDDFYSPIKRIQKLGAMWGVILLSVLAMLIFLSIGILTKPLVSMLTTFKLIESGNLDKNLEVVNNDEIGKIANGFNKLIAVFRDVVNKLSTGLELLFNKKNSLNDISNRIARSSDVQAQSLDNVSIAIKETGQHITQMAEKTQGLAANVEEITATTEELSASAQSVDEKAKDIKEKAAVSTESMLNASSVSQETLHSIKNIEESANQIKKILTLINDIADQTNLLALNASIEAARAGEAGRGFAVVAKEISNLADKSSNATKEIEELIFDTSHNVDVGVELASKLDKAIADIRNALNLFVGHADEMEVAIEEEKRGFDQIASTMQNVNIETQNLASSSEEIASALEEIEANLEQAKPMIERNTEDAHNLQAVASELSNIADHLKEMIAFFKGY